MTDLSRLQRTVVGLAVALIAVLGTGAAGTTTVAAAPAAATTTTLEVPATADYGTPTGIAVLVADAANPATYPIGWAQVLEGDVEVARVQLWSGRGYVELTPPMGSHTYTARYEGSTDHAASSAAAATMVVGKTPTRASVSGTNWAKVGERVTFTASAGPTSYRYGGTADARGDYTLFIDGEAVGTKTLQQGWCCVTWEFTVPEAGEYILEATYSGNDAFLPAESETTLFTGVRYVVDTMIGSSKGGSGYSCSPPASQWPSCAPNAAAGEPVVLKAIVYARMDQKPDPPLPGGTTTFFVDGEPVGTAPTIAGLAELVTTLEAGGHWIDAVYHGDTYFEGAQTGSMPFYVTAALPPVPPVTTDPVLIGAGTPRSGYWMAAADGTVYNFGTALHHGNGSTRTVDLEPTPSGGGYWLLNEAGMVTPRGNAVGYGSATLGIGDKAVSLSATPSGGGYWIFTSTGRVIAKGDAAFLGDMSKVALNAPVLDSVATPSGKGYWMVASDGGIFTYGDARFSGSTGHLKLNRPVMSMAADPDGTGYWLVASDGGIFAFDAPFRGSMGSQPLNKPVSGIVPGADGYLMVAEDGGIFSFGNIAFHGSLGATPPKSPVVAVALQR